MIFAWSRGSHHRCFNVPEVPPEFPSTHHIYCLGTDPPLMLPCACPPLPRCSGFGCAHRALCDLGMEPTLPGVDEAYNALLAAVRDRA